MHSIGLFNGILVIYQVIHEQHEQVSVLSVSQACAV